MHKRAKVWVADDDSSIRWVLERALTQAGIANESFADADELLKQLASGQPDVIISDIRMPGTNGLELLASMSESYPHVPVIITTAHSDLDSAVASYQKGAFEYLPKPFDLDEMIDVLLNGSFNMCKAATPYFREQESGSFVLFTSPSAMIGNPHCRCSLARPMKRCER